jgi:hypothetical protein
LLNHIYISPIFSCFPKPTHRKAWTLFALTKKP